MTDNNSKSSKAASKIQKPAKSIKTEKSPKLQAKEVKAKAKFSDRESSVIGVLREVLKRDLQRANEILSLVDIQYKTGGVTSTKTKDGEVRIYNEPVVPQLSDKPNNALSHSTGPRVLMMVDDVIFTTFLKRITQTSLQTSDLIPGKFSNRVFDVVVFDTTQAKPKKFLLQAKTDKNQKLCNTVLFYRLRPHQQKHLTLFITRVLKKNQE